jgi:hypothetical protein
MTTPIIVSHSVLDADGNKMSHPIYCTFDEVTQTLGDITTFVAATGVLLDAVTDGQIIRSAFQMLLGASIGIKTAPVAGSNVQETGLFNFPLVDAINRSYGDDVPAFFQGGFLGKVIDLTNTDVAAYTAMMLGSLALDPTDRYFSHKLASVRSGKKSFRK